VRSTYKHVGYKHDPLISDIYTVALYSTYKHVVCAEPFKIKVNQWQLTTFIGTSNKHRIQL